jgi:hypothetical protein
MVTRGALGRAHPAYGPRRGLGEKAPVDRPGIAADMPGFIEAIEEIQRSP